MPENNPRVLALVYASGMPIVRAAVINAEWGNPAPLTGKILQGIAGDWDPDVWLVCETNRGRVRRWLGNGYRAHQGRLYGRQNNAVAWQQAWIGPGRGSFFLGTFPLGAVMETRWFNRQWLHHGKADPVAWHVLHVPPYRYQRLVPRFMRRLYRRSKRITRQVWGGDKNLAPMREWARSRDLHYREAGVMFLASAFPIREWHQVKVDGLSHSVIIADLDID